MVEGQVSTQELIAGRYRQLEVVHREEGRTDWLGEDVAFGRPVSLTESRLAPRLREETPRRTAARILRECEALALMFPGQVAPVLDVVEEHDALWTVTERIDGTPLGELMDQGPLNCVRAARLGLALLDVLEAAHRRGVTHGDLSPGQVFVMEGGAVVVTGFGLIGASPAQRVTAPSYASPEQARGETAGPASDQWSLGAMLYAMVEGRPPIRERGDVKATLRAVDRLPLRSPVSAGPLAPAITGLLRRDPLERVPEPVVRASLARILSNHPDAEPEALLSRFQGAWVVAHRAGRAWDKRSVRRSLLLGAALVVAASSVAVYAAMRDTDDTTSSVTRPGRSPSAAASTTPSVSAGPSGDSTESNSLPQQPPSPTPPTSASSSAAAKDPNAGFHRYNAPEGFSVCLPDGFKRIHTTKTVDLSYRLTFGASGDARTLAVTYSTVLGPDPVAIWRDVESSLRRTYDDYERVGDIRAVDYRGRDGADMEWLATEDGVRLRTYGRGFLLGGGRGFSLRWTVPAAGFKDAGNQKALDVFFRTFRPTTA